MDNLLVPLHETYRLVDESIRPGNSSSDILAVLRPIGSVATDVSVPFKPGSKVYYVKLTEANVTEMAAVNGQVPLTGQVEDLSDATATKVLILGKSLNQQF